MDKKTKNSKTAKDSPVKTLKLKRETIKDLSGHEKKQVKGGGGAGGSVIQSRIV